MHTDTVGLEKFFNFLTFTSQVPCNYNSSCLLDYFDYHLQWIRNAMSMEKWWYNINSNCKTGTLCYLMQVAAAWLTHWVKLKTFLFKSIVMLGSPPLIFPLVMLSFFAKYTKTLNKYQNGKAAKLCGEFFVGFFFCKKHFTTFDKSHWSRLFMVNENCKIMNESLLVNLKPT